MSFKDIFKKSFLEGYASSEITTVTIVAALAVACVLALYIFFVYRIMTRKTFYSRNFGIALVGVALITAALILTMQSSVVLSLGMVGALSIVRFRTAIKDPRDTTYIFWAIAVGVCCGICDYLIAGIGSAVIFCMMVLIGNVRGNDRYLLIVRTSGTPDTRVEELMQSYYQNKARLRVKNTASQQSEYIYELSASVLNKHGGSEEISNELYALAGVQNVNLVCQNDEITA